MFFSNREIPPGYHLIDNPKKLSWLANELSDVEEMGFDIETNHPTIKSKAKPEGFKEALTGISFSWNYKPQKVWTPGTAAYVPIRKADDAPFWGSRQDVALKIISEILDSDIDKTAQNGKFDVYKLCVLEDIRVKKFTFDIMLAHDLIDEARLVSSHALKSDFNKDGKIVKLGTSDAYLDTSASQYKDDMASELKFYDDKYKRYSKVPLKTLYPYGCGDSDYLLPLKYIFKQKLIDEGMLWIFDNLIMPLQHELTMAELHGVPLDIKMAECIQMDQERIMYDLNSIVHKACGVEFNIGSEKQLGTVLFETLGLKGQRNEHGAWKVDGDSLKRLDHPAIEPISKWKRAQKIRGSFAVPALREVEEITNDGRIGWVHPSYFIPTLTGRLTMGDPVLNALPRPENGGDIVKSMWCAASDYRFIFKDFSQIELREIAHFSQEPLWVDGFRAGHDMHSAMAQKIWHPDCEVSDIKKLHGASRSKAKGVNFGIAFGKTIWSLARDLGITTDEADILINRDYYGAAPVLKTWIDDMHQHAVDYGYVYNIFGRMRHLPDAQLEVPEGVYWPKKNIRPKCYRNGPRLTDVELEYDDMFRVYDDDLKLRVRQTGKEILMKCVECLCLKSCIVNGYVKYISGRFQKAMRQAVNAPIQGSAVDMASICMVWIGQELRNQGLDASVILHLHDELGIYCHHSCVEQVCKIMDYFMTDYLVKFTNFSVPIPVDTAICQRWSDKHDQE